MSATIPHSGQGFDKYDGVPEAAGFGAHTIDASAAQRWALGQLEALWEDPKLSAAQRDAAQRSVPHERFVMCDLPRSKNLSSPFPITIKLLPSFAD